jgi:hypothetical protein
MGHGQNKRLTKWRSYILMYVVHGVKSIAVCFLFHQWCMVYLLDEIEVWNDWNCSICEVEIVVTRKFKYLWLDHKGEYLSYKFSKHLRVKGIIPQTCIVIKHHMSMEFLMDVIKPCLTWLDQWWNKTTNIICGLCFRDYRFSLNRVPS